MLGVLSAAAARLDKLARPVRLARLDGVAGFRRGPTPLPMGDFGDLTFELTMVSCDAFGGDEAVLTEVVAS